MERERRVEFRTVRNRIRVADIEITPDAVIFVVKHRGVKDAFTLEELLRQVYGQGMRCVIYNGESVLTIIE